MKKNAAMFTISVFLLFLISGCDKLSLFAPKKAAPKETSSQPAMVVHGTLIAKVNNMPVTLEDLNQEIDAYNAAMTSQNRPEAKITTREQKLVYLKDQKIHNVLLYQEALDRGLDRQEEVIKSLDKAKQDLLVFELYRLETNKIEVSNKEIEDAYNTYKDQLKEPEERQVREIMVPTEQEAKEIVIQLMQGQDFATLAKERSKAASKENGGDLGFIKRGDKFSQFENAAFSDSLEAGKISSIFKGPEGYYILKLEAKRGGKQKSLSELWDDIKKYLTFLKQQQRIDELIGKLSREAKIEIYESEIK